MRLVLVAIVVAAAGLCATGSAAPLTRDRLTITLWPQGRGVGKPVSSATLRCRPPGGTHPHPIRACRRLLAHLDGLQPVPATRVCSGVYGGPQVALVRGRVKGRHVSSWLNRKNGCEIERWDALGVVLRV